jgi:hypothetical protein
VARWPGSGRRHCGLRAQEEHTLAAVGQRSLCKDLAGVVDRDRLLQLTVGWWDERVEVVLVAVRPEQRVRPIAGAADDLAECRYECPVIRSSAPSFQPNAST